ncbi:MAG TPA: alkaline phosphatase D family protein [Allosphingosinicella sp.]|jgi:alkaline phosphatase D
MTLDLGRRLLLKGATLGFGALAVPGIAQLAAVRGFTHGLASGEPRQRSVMLWTRFVPPRRSSGRLEWQVSETQDFRRIAAAGPAFAVEETDFCVKAVAQGLRPGRWYFYRFVSRGPGPADSDIFSSVGRTRTLPEGRTPRFSIGIFSCSNLGFGWFNAYAHAAARRDLDLIVHLGDYLYEYPSGTYPSDPMPGRPIEPAGEAIALADYRLRYAAYRADPDLQALHAAFPMVMMWDDHESANDSWQGGAENHDPDKEGAWSARRVAAQRAAREWLPISQNSWEAYDIGDLATLFRPETRLVGRSEPPSYGQVVAGKENIAAALAAFRDGAWRNPERTMLGTEQEAWLVGALKRSTGGGTRWQVLAQQTIMGSLVMPPEAKGWISPDAPEFVRRRSALAGAAAGLGLPLNLDAWDGYPAARERLLRTALDADANLLVLAGDSHNGWAFDLDLGGTAAGVELAGHSVTSPGLEAYAPKVAPADIATAFRARNRQLRWADVSRRGYLTLTLTPRRATGEWHFLETIRTRSTRLAGSRRMSVERGSNRFA